MGTREGLGPWHKVLIFSPYSDQRSLRCVIYFPFVMAEFVRPRFMGRDLRQALRHLDYSKYE